MRSCCLQRRLGMLSGGQLRSGWQPQRPAGAPSRASPHRRMGAVRTFASAGTESESKIKTTLSDLDAILGIEEKKEEEEEVVVQAPTARPEISVSPEVVAALAKAEAERSAAAAGSSPESTRAVQQQIDRLTEQAKRLSDGAKQADTAGDQALRKQFEDLAAMLTSHTGINHDDVKVIKEEVFKRTAFWVTEAKALPGVLGGILIRGNLKGPSDTVFSEVCAGTQAALGDKYIVRLVEDVELQMQQQMQALEMGIDPEPAGSGPPRVAFEFLPAATCQPPEMARWQRVAAGVLAVLTLGTTFTLGLGASLGLIPKEMLLWFANPDNLGTDLYPPGWENFDPLPVFQAALDVAAITLLPQLSHELGHTAVAAVKKIKTGASFLVPNNQLGTLGSVTQLKSYVKNRSDLWDFSVAGLAAGGVAAFALFMAGLALSHGGSTPEAGLVPVPTQLFQGSLFLGGLARLAFGSDVVQQAQVWVHPALIGGWCGMVATAFNSLPCGTLDGGRSFQAAWGRNGLAVSSILTYVGLGLSLLGSSLAWTFGIYVLICQREAERYIQDEVTPVSERRQAFSAALLVLALLVLLPMAPEVADIAAVGPPSDFL